MADIRINQLPAGGGPVATDFLPLDNGSTRKATVQQVVEIGRPSASQAEAEAGTNPTKAMTPLTTKQSIASEVGVSVQAYDAGLTSISGLVTAADQMLYTTGSDAYATTALTPFARTILDDANAADVQSTIGLVIGTNVQAFDADLTAIAALTSAADKIPYATGAGTWAMADFTAAGRALVDDADAAAQRTTLGLGGAAVLNVGTTAGTVAAGNDSRIVNAAQLVGGVLQNSNLPTRLRESTTSATVTDCNLAVASGLYWADGSATNRPSTGDTFWIDVVGNNANFIFQRASGLNSGGVWIRRNVSGVWGSWRKDYGAENGRAIGNSLVYEDFGGFPALNTDSRIILRKATSTNADVYNVAVLRTAAAGGTAGFVNNALRVETTVDSVTATFEWALLAKLNVNAAGGGEHCALYSQAVKTADGSAWAHCVEARDTVVNPTTGTLGIELGMFIQGGDSSGMRHALDISIGSADSLAGTNIVTTAIRIGPTTGDATRAQLVNGMQIKGRVGTGIDLSLLDVSYSTTTFRMPTNGIISWRDNNQTLRGEIGWNATINTWQLTGVLNATSATAGGATALPATPQGYMHFQLNGTMRKVPYYAV